MDHPSTEPEINSEVLPIEPEESRAVSSEMSLDAPPPAPAKRGRAYLGFGCLVAIAVVCGIAAAGAYFLFSTDAIDLKLSGSESAESRRAARRAQSEGAGNDGGARAGEEQDAGRPVWSRGHDSAGPKGDGSIQGEIIVPGAMPSTLDPALVRDVVSAQYMYEIYSGLVTLSPDLEVVPDLAKSWTVDASGTRYTFKLREDAFFHDGASVSADAVAFGIERSCDPAVGSLVAEAYLGDILGCPEKLAGQATTVRGVEVPDEHTIIIEIDAPKSYFLSKLTYPTAFALDPLQVEGNPSWIEQPNGSGPFRLAKFAPDEEIVLEAHADYYGEGPYLERVVYDLRPIAALTRFENGEIDAAPVGAGDIQRIRDPLNPLSAFLVEGPGDLGLNYIGFNLSRPPFDDVHLRRAFNYAIDKARLGRVVMHDTVLPIYGILPPGMPGFDAGLSPYSYDPQKAREELAASRYGSADAVPPITLHMSGAGGVDGLTRAFVDEIDEVLGIQIEVEQSEWELFQHEISENAYPMFMLGWSADYADPQDFLDVLFHSESPLSSGGYANPELDRVLEAARIERNPETRFDLYHQAERMILDDAPWLPLYTGRETWLVAPDIEGFELPPIVLPRMARLRLQP